MMRPCQSPDTRALELLSQWLETPFGKRVQRAEAACIERMIEDSFGHYLAQIACGNEFGQVLQHSRIRSRLLLSEHLLSAASGDLIQARPSALPLEAASIDAVLLPHTLDFYPQPQPVLREVERVLIPEGRVFITGFNPFSTWGLRRALNRPRRVPWCGNQLSASRLIDWLDLLGLQLEMRQWLLFRPPVRTLQDRPLSWLEHSGLRWWPMLGGVYVLRAVKRVSLATPLRPRWRTRPLFLPGEAVKPTAREVNHV